MDNTQASAPASPVHVASLDNATGNVTSHECYWGLTKREKFAESAMKSLALARANPQHVAKMAVNFADALIDALNEEKSQ